MRTTLISQIDPAVIREIVRHPCVYLKLYEWNLEPFVSNFGDIPAPWPMTPNRVLDADAWRTAPDAEDPRPSELDDGSDVPNFESWSEARWRKLADEVLCDDKLID